MLKLLSADIPEPHLVKIKKLITTFFFDKARDKADAIWDSKGYTNEKPEQNLNKN